MNTEDLKAVLDKHRKWLDNEDGGERANLRGANLSGAGLSEANLRGAKSLFVPQACPDSGSFVGWKKCRSGLVVKLLIPEDAKRSSATGRKCRCDKAAVLAIENEDGTPSAEAEAISHHDFNFSYTIGETVSVENYDENRWNECAPGIHFFIIREEAAQYEF